MALSFWKSLSPSHVPTMDSVPYRVRCVGHRTLILDFIGAAAAFLCFWVVTISRHCIATSAIWRYLRSSPSKTASILGVSVVVGFVASNLCEILSVIRDNNFGASCLWLPTTTKYCVLAFMCFVLVSCVDGVGYHPAASILRLSSCSTAVLLQVGFSTRMHAYRSRNHIDSSALY